MFYCSKIFVGGLSRDTGDGMILKKFIILFKYFQFLKHYDITGDVNELTLLPVDYIPVLGCVDIVSYNHLWSLAMYR